MLHGKQNDLTIFVEMSEYVVDKGWHDDEFTWCRVSSHEAAKTIHMLGIFSKIALQLYSVNVCMQVEGDRFHLVTQFCYRSEM